MACTRPLTIHFLFFAVLVLAGTTSLASGSCEAVEDDETSLLQPSLTPAVRRSPEGFALADAELLSGRPQPDADNEDAAAAAGPPSLESLAAGLGRQLQQAAPAQGAAGLLSLESLTAGLERQLQQVQTRAEAFSAAKASAHFGTVQQQLHEFQEGGTSDEKPLLNLQRQVKDAVAEVDGIKAQLLGELQKEAHLVDELRTEVSEAREATTLEVQNARRQAASVAKLAETVRLESSEKVKRATDAQQQAVKWAKDAQKQADSKVSWAKAVQKQADSKVSWAKTAQQQADSQVRWADATQQEAARAASAMEKLARDQLLVLARGMPPGPQAAVLAGDVQ